MALCAKASTISHDYPQCISPPPSIVASWSFVSTPASNKMAWKELPASLTIENTQGLGVRPIRKEGSSNKKHRIIIMNHVYIYNILSNASVSWFIELLHLAASAAVDSCGSYSLRYVNLHPILSASIFFNRILALPKPCASNDSPWQPKSSQLLAVLVSMKKICNGQNPSAHHVQFLGWSLQWCGGFCSLHC